jgi:hypothetical protein
MKLLTAKELNIIRGKVMVGGATIAEMLSVFGHLDAMEDKLDKSNKQDCFGTKGWRPYFGLD